MSTAKDTFAIRFADPEPGELPPERFNMAAYAIGRAARLKGNAPALIVVSDLSGLESEVWSFRELEGAVLRVAAALRIEGFVPGDRIMIRLDNTSAYALLFFGAIAGGYVPLPVSSNLSEREAAFILRDSGAAAVAIADHVKPVDLPHGVRVFTVGDVAAMISNSGRVDYAPTTANDPAFLIYTSGTTAEPKGVLHAHRATFGRRPMYRGWYGIEGNDRVLHTGAFNWTFTLGTGLTDPWANGATAIIYTGDKTPALWPELICKTEATIFAAVPGLYRQILKYGAVTPGSFGSLRHGLIAGETPPPGLFEEWQTATGTPLYEALGMSEISTYVSTGPDVARRPGTIGRAQPGRRVTVLPERGGDQPVPANTPGLLAVHRADPGLMLGYWKRPEEEAAVWRGEWFVGGDFASIDADGYVTHLGRANDIMNALGYRVGPQEVEAVLAECPGVAEVACAETRVRVDVSVICAFIVLQAGVTLEAETLLAFAKARLASYKMPREVRFVDQLPRTANGKIKRSDLAGLVSLSKTA